MRTFCQSCFLRLGFTDNDISNSFDGTSLGSSLPVFFLLCISVVLTLLLRGAVLLHHVQDNFSRMLIGIFGTSDRMHHEC